MELARAFQCELHVIAGAGAFRHLACCLKTIRLLMISRPSLLFVQNPSMILAAVACLYRIFTGRRVVVDRHTTFRLNRGREFSLDYLVFLLLHRFTLKHADFTIVTNTFLAQLVTDAGGRPLILPDKLPDVAPTARPELQEGFSVLAISSFGGDEPIGLIFQAMQSLVGEDITLYVTGNFKKLFPELTEALPPNVRFTGFLPEQEFINMLNAVNAVMVLTTADHCMLCGCYEAVSAAKPLITSNKAVLADYFDRAVLVENSTDGIAAGIRFVRDNLPACQREVQVMKDEIEVKWQSSFQSVQAALEVQ
ncbi:glycosyltransferase family protein [Geomonas diazotrophica]|uniref:hypothetical protein n=1 Tax=Geomonas diazotrophica TaxID=2843197 RepID=UPI001C127605|nr:hypothetical protein [Geomonas diazotrophica]